MRISHWKSKVLFTAFYIILVILLYHLGVSCVFKELFGICCPGCGMTRAMLAVLRLDFAAAFRHHPMFWSVPILYLYFLFDNGLFKKKAPNVILLGAICVGFVANWLNMLV